MSGLYMKLVGENWIGGCDWCDEEGVRVVKCVSKGGDELNICSGCVMELSMRVENVIEVSDEVEIGDKGGFIKKGGD